jgi:stage II sporulation protein R
MTIFKYKAFNERKDKILLSSIAIIFILYMAFSFTYFSASTESVRDDVVRLHILANSDSEKDQAVKLLVRDALLNENTRLLSGGVDTENAEEYFLENKEKLLEAAKETLQKNNFDYVVSISLGKEYFETRSYGKLIFPAGEYTSLKVILGEGKGHNWWCVMFPPLCVPAADDVEIEESKTAAYLTRGGEKIVNGGNKYIIKFKILELYEELRNELLN